MLGFGRAISDTCDGEKEKCKGAGGGCHAKHFSSKKAPFYECYEKISCLVTICFFQAVVFVYF